VQSGGGSAAPHGGGGEEDEPGCDSFAPHVGEATLDVVSSAAR
jgi:hypothetical protein